MPAAGRQTMGYGALLVVAYLLFFFLNFPESTLSRGSIAKPAALPKLMVAAASRQTSVVAREKLQPGQIEEPAQNTPPEESSSASRNLPFQAVSPHELNRQIVRDSVRILGEQAVSGVGAGERQSALVKLGTRVPTPEAVNALYTALTADAAVPNRVTAVQSVSMLLRRHRDDGGDLRHLLEMAAHDADPAVVIAAQQALAEIPPAAHD